jgi:medium-chain acyl-[acyl-carrier-protein] hydrolase
MYTINSRVRYSETDEYGQLSLVGIINYMQDCSTFQSEDARVGVEYLDSNHKAWLLSSWQIMIDRYPRLGEKLVVGTWHCSFKGIYGYRNFVLLDGEGRHLVRAGSVWFLYDTEKNTPIRVHPEDTAPYGKAEAPLILSPAPRKIPVPDHYGEGKPIVVARHHIDTNHHVNNAQYVDMARESIPEGLRIREIRADYKKAAVLGNVIIPRVSQGSAHEWTVSLDDSATQDTYAVVWLQTEPQMQEKLR